MEHGILLPHRNLKSAFLAFGLLVGSSGSLQAQLTMQAPSDSLLLLEIGELLYETVDLNRGDLRRLMVLPFLDEALVDSLRAKRPIVSWQQVTDVLGHESAEQIRSFVHWRQGPVRQAALDWSAALNLQPRRRSLRLKAATPWASAAFRRRQEGPGTSLVAGFVRLNHGDWQVLWGDQGISHGHGLLLARGIRSSRQALVSYAPRLPRGSTSVFSGHLLRGTAVSHGGSYLQVSIVRGHRNLEPVSIIKLGFSAPGRGQLDVLQLEEGSRRWSAAAKLKSGAIQAGIEVVPHPRGWAWSSVSRLQTDWGRYALNVQANPPHTLPPTSRLSSTRRKTRHRSAGLFHERRFERWSLRLAWVSSLREDSLGSAERGSDFSWLAHWKGRSWELDVFAGSRWFSNQSVSQESLETVENWASRSLRLTATWERRDYLWRLQFREAVDHTASWLRGRSWQMSLRRQLPTWEWRWLLTAFDVPSGRLPVYVSEPGVLGGFHAVRLLGRGVRLALGVKLERSALDLRLHAAAEHTRRHNDYILESSFVLRNR